MMRLTEDELWPAYNLHIPTDLTDAVDVPVELVNRWEAARLEFTAVQAELHALTNPDFEYQGFSTR